MKRTVITQTMFIDGADGHDTSAQFNEAMMSLADMKPRFEREGNTFWIFYTVEKVEAETLTEECEMAGCDAHCIDCPYIVRDLNRFGNVDARKKWATCGKTGERTSIGSRACDIYYEAFGRKEKE